MSRHQLGTLEGRVQGPGPRTLKTKTGHRGTNDTSSTLPENGSLEDQFPFGGKRPIFRGELLVSGKVMISGDVGWWFGILRVPLRNNPFHHMTQTTNPNHQLTIS